MLPEILSEHLCSLRANCDRYAMSVIWEFDKKSGKILDVWFGRTIIHSKYELPYELAQKIIDGRLNQKEKRMFGNQLTKLNRSLFLLLQLSRKLRRARMNRGALELASDEIKFDLDKQRNPIKVPLLSLSYSHFLFSGKA